MDQAVQDYIDGIAPEHRPLFDRLHGLILEIRPDVSVTLSYKMPTYQVGRRRFHLATWNHGVSVYGTQGRDSGFAERHADLLHSKTTIQLRPDDAVAIPDDEFRQLFRAALEG
jgi:uncharacterized protein YdhG (YjbR/CyaY superfamily)